MPRKIKQASVAPPAATQGMPLAFGVARAALVAAVVAMLRVAVPDAVPAIEIGLVEPKLSVGGY
jgi:hypothetical protein